MWNVTHEVFESWLFACEVHVTFLYGWFYISAKSLHVFNNYNIIIEQSIDWWLQIHFILIGWSSMQMINIRQWFIIFHYSNLIPTSVQSGLAPLLPTSHALSSYVFCLQRSHRHHAVTAGRVRTGVHVWNTGARTFARAKPALTLSMITRTSTLMVSAGEHEDDKWLHLKS